MQSEKVATVLGTIGTVLWCIQLIPQIWFNWRRKDCTGFPPLMMVLWLVSAVPFGAYFIGQRSTLPLQIQPQLFYFFCCVAFAQTLYYPPVKLAWLKVFAIVAGLTAACGGIEAALILTLRPLQDRGIHFPMLIVGIFAAVLLGLGLLPPYFEMWKHKGRAIGFNFVFLAMDSSGAIFSLASVAVQPGEKDYLGMILYIVVLILELGIFVSHFVWKLRVKYFGLVPVQVETDAEPEIETPDDKSEKAAVEEACQTA